MQCPRKDKISHSSAHLQSFPLNSCILWMGSSSELISCHDSLSALGVSVLLYTGETSGNESWHGEEEEQGGERQPWNIHTQIHLKI